eukprot:Gb_20327 [translate_table: standard]
MSCHQQLTMAACYSLSNVRGVHQPERLCRLLPLHSQTANCISPIHMGRRRRASSLAVKACSGGHDFGSGGPNIVDANLILLRKRIYELKSQEKNDKFSEEWMEWEKRAYPTYRRKVFEGVGWLQCNLINTRPTVAIGMLSLMSLSVSASVFLVLLTGADHLCQFAMAFLSNFH